MANLFTGPVNGQKFTLHMVSDTAGVGTGFYAKYEVKSALMNTAQSVTSKNLFHLYILSVMDTVTLNIFIYKVCIKLSSDNLFHYVLRTLFFLVKNTE